MFKALSDPIRVAVVEMIGREPEQEACFETIAANFDLPQSTLSHHMKVLVNSGVLLRDRRQTYSWYRIDTAAMDSAARLLQPGGLRPQQ